jgi:hypothetical protein
MINVSFKTKTSAIDAARQAMGEQAIPAVDFSIIKLGTKKYAWQAIRQEIPATEEAPKAPKAPTEVELKVVDLCTRIEGASRKELFAAAGWSSSIAPVVVLRSLAKRFNFDLITIKGEDKRVRYHLTSKVSQ